MLSQYLNAAMRQARYELIDNPQPFYGEIPACRGVWATGSTLEECRQELVETLEEWIVLCLQKALPIPEIEGINIASGEPAPRS
jgi:predicted RNase H-like HicB family nuclease